MSNDESTNDISAAAESGTPVRSRHVLGIAVLEGLTAVYASAAVLIFIAGWLKPLLAIALFAAVVACVGYSAYRAVRWAQENPPADPDAPALQWKWRTGLAIFFTVAILVLCTGAGGFTFQFYDYWHYDGMLKCAITYPWPMGGMSDFPKPGTLIPGSAYLGYWLPAALTGKLMGWEVGYVFQYPWNVLGVMLAVVWFMRIVGTTRYLFALLFLFFGGLDLLGYLWVSPLPDGVKTTWVDYLTGTYWWSIGRGWMAHWSSTAALLTPEGQAVAGGYFFRFYGLMSFLSDGPHHVLPSLITILVVIHDALRRNTIERLFLLTSFFPLATIFSTIGTVPVLALCTWHTRARGLLNLGNIVVGPVLVVMFALYYTTIENNMPQGWVWNFQDVAGNWSAFVLYYLCGFGIYALLAPSMKGDGYRPGRVWFYAAIAFFVFAPWYRMGVFGDFTTKTVVPSQMVFLICLATAIHKPEGAMAGLRQRALVAALVLGAWAGFGPVIRALDYGFSYGVPPLSRVAYPFDTVGLAPDAQMKFNPDSAFWKHFARPIEYMPTPPNELQNDYSFVTGRESLENWVFFTEDVVQGAEGVTIVTEGNQPLLRRYNAELLPERIGALLLEHQVVDESGNTPDYGIYFHWANVADVTANGDEWPFHRWKTSILYPPANPQQPISTNSYWRGDVAQFALYFQVNDPVPGMKYTVTIKSLEMFRRTTTPALQAK